MYITSDNFMYFDSLKIMGKSKNQKHKNVFKVSSNRSTKAKNKLKSLNADRLKNVSAQNRQKIESLDKQLVTLNEEIRQVPQQKCTTKVPPVISSSKTQQLEKYKEVEEKCQQALEVLNSFKM